MSINAEYTNGEYHAKNPSFHVEDSAWKALQIVKGIERCGLAPASILEIGCGAGEILVQLSKHLPRPTFTGYELSPQGYALCLERASERIGFFNSSPFDDSRHFDLSLCIDVIEHIEDYFSFLRALLEKADFHIFHIPLDMNTQMVARAEPILRVRREVGHIHYFSKETALAALQETGFEILDSFYTPGGIERSKSLKSNLLRAPRKLLALASPDLTARFLGGFSLLVIAKGKR